MKPFVVNRHGQLVFPSSYFPDLDFSVFETLEQFDEVVRRDFEEKAPTAADIVERIGPAATRPVSTCFAILACIGSG